MQERGSRQRGFPHCRSSQLGILKSNTHVRVSDFFFFFFNHASSPYACHYSLLDPSCSGSGIVNRLDHLLESGQFRELLLCSTLICRRERRDGGTGEPPHQTRQLSTDDDQARYEM